MPACPERDVLVAHVRARAEAAEPGTRTTVFLDGHATDMELVILIEADSSDVFEGGPIHTTRQRRAVGAAYRTLADALHDQTTKVIKL